MPNHVYSTAEIIGPPKVLDEITKLAENGESILKHYFPLPDEAIKTVTFTAPDGTEGSYKVFTDSGYDTACELWGSKWADYNVELFVDARADSDPYIKIKHASAWSPVIEGYRKLSEKLPIAVVLTYQEEGYAYVGAASVAGGQVISESDFTDGAIDTFLETKGLREAPDFEDDAWISWISDRDALIDDLIAYCDDNVTTILLNALDY